MLISSILLGCLVTLLSYFIVFMNKRLNYWQSLGIASEKPNFLLGNFTGLRSERSFTEIWLAHYKKFKGTGPFSGFYWFSHPAVFILDTELMKTILIKEFHKFADRGFFHNPEDDPLTGQLFMLDGARWKNLRQKLTPTFSSGKIKLMFATVKRVAEELVMALEKKSKEEADNIVELRDILARFGTDVIGSCAFGIECNSLTNPEAKFHIMGRRLMTEQRHGQLGNALIFNFPKFVKKLHWKMIPDDISEFFMGLVRDTIQYREENQVKRNDFLDMLMELKDNQVIKTENGEESTKLTLGEMAAQMVLFFTAGFETSSTTLGFSLYELARHENMQQQLRQEINEVWLKYEKNFNYDSLKEMIYLNQVIQETLRLYTVLPVLNRCCLEDFPVPGHPKYIIKKGMNVLIPAIAVHRDEEFYPLANEFNPDNFLPSKVLERDSILHLPFGEGPRNCIGLRFGQMQTRLALAFLVQNFKFSVCAQTQIPPVFDKNSYFLGAEKGVYLKVEKI
ncbi:cytochrome P450 6a9-like [Calliphora vicina]|uniref:cytochrome P450 6a9-like n=1 Tax=Calliphora vicina TaxID=7373 RepID=UPI00325B14BD